MGLDQYLYAERRWAAGSAEGRKIVEAAALTPEQLKSLETDRREGYPWVYIGGWGFSPGDEREQHARVLEAVGLVGFATPFSLGAELQPEPEVRVRLTCAYWRKANAIHRWFVDNAQDGTDDCDTYEVAAEQLAHLRSLCQQAIEAYDRGDIDTAGQLLTPTSGFFFGSTEVDDFYREDLAHSVTEIERVIGLAATTPGVMFYYHSSW